jgi:hypothetical protein
LLTTVKTGSSTPNTSTFDGSSPISSCASRIAVIIKELSLRSTPPPGKAISPPMTYPTKLRQTVAMLTEFCILRPRAMTAASIGNHLSPSLSSAAAIDQGVGWW